MSWFSVRPGPGTVVFAIFELCFVFIRGYYANTVRQAKKTSDYKGGALEPIFLWTFFALYNVVPSLYFVLPSLTLGGYSPKTSAWVLAGVGAAIYTFGLWMFYRAHADLGKFWSVTLKVRKDHSIVKTGVYRVLRHPMYASGFLMAIAKAMLISNYIFGLAPLLSMALVAQYRIKHEENMLIRQFGEEYEEYMADVGGLIPKWPTTPKKSTGIDRNVRAKAIDHFSRTRYHNNILRDHATKRARVLLPKSLTFKTHVSQPNCPG